MALRKSEKPRGILNDRDAGSMPSVWRYFPSPDLAPFVEHYWTVEWDLPEPQLRETLPHPSIHLVLEAGREALAGIHTKKFSRMIAGKDRVFSAKFRPGGFRPFIDRPVSTLSERVWNLADVLGPTARGLCERALEHADHHATIGVLEDFLRPFHPRANDSLRLVQRIAERVTDDRAITHVEHIVEIFDIGKRTLQRLFDEYVGVTPKWMIQRFRLIEAANRIHLADPPDWADVALGLGYADQAHFIRDFKKIVGLSPGDYHARLSTLPSRP
ncbi:MAG TPA: helix-turn-helix domain-containing protein [Rudaea sp.]|nr:helix-turn-helix domain-containing protein [Rudaea sp.]